MTTQYITQNKQILNGAPVIAGTRIPMQRVLELQKRGYTDSRLSKELAVNPKKLRAAMNELSNIGLDTIGR